VDQQEYDFLVEVMVENVPPKVERIRQRAARGEEEEHSHSSLSSTNASIPPMYVLQLEAGDLGAEVQLLR
jgi:hypothetical protein